MIALRRQPHALRFRRADRGEPVNKRARPEVVGSQSLVPQKIGLVEVKREDAEEDRQRFFAGKWTLGLEPGVLEIPEHFGGQMTTRLPVLLEPVGSDLILRHQSVLELGVL